MSIIHMSISLKIDQIRLSLLLARRFTTDELNLIELPEDKYDISCEFEFGDKKFAIKDNISVDNCIEVVIDENNSVICHKDKDYISKIYYIIYKAINYRNYGDIHQDFVIERDILDALAKSIARYCTMKDVYKLEYLIDVADYSQYSIPFKLVSKTHFSFIKKHYMFCFNIYEDGVRRHRDIYYFKDNKMGSAKLELVLQKIKTVLKEGNQ